MSAPRTRPAGDRLVYMPTTPSLQINPGDAVYENSSGAVLPASSQADAGTPAGNKSTFAAAFRGIANGQKRAEDAGVGEIPVIVGSDVEFTLGSPTTVRVGQFIAPTENSAGDGLEDQLFEVTATANEAIAIISENKTNATKVFAFPVSEFAGNRPS